MIHIQISTENAAFKENPNEIRAILEDLSYTLQNSKPGDSGSIHDSNGNTVGSWSIK
jgi:hypothetical protein